jgi:hypothetical protein
MADNVSRLAKIANQNNSGIRYYFPENLASEEKNTARSSESSKFAVFSIKQRQSANRSSPLGFIALPIPSIFDGVNVSYTQSDFGIGGAAAIGSVVGSFSGLSTDFSTILKNTVSSFNASNFSKMASDMALSGTPILKASINQGQGVIQSSFMTNVFSNSGFRSFSFSYDLIPKNNIEAESLKNIVKQFKKSMMPVENYEESSGIKKRLGIQNLPDIFDINFYPSIGSEYRFEKSEKRPGSRYMVSIRNAVLEKFDVEYTSGTATPTFYNDGHPFSTKFSMTFKETEIYTRERNREEFSHFLETLG